VAEPKNLLEKLPKIAYEKTKNEISSIFKCKHAFFGRLSERSLKNLSYLLVDVVSVVRELSQKLEGSLRAYIPLPGEKFKKC